MPVDCRCGHPQEFHAHFHERGYCGTCGPKLCDRYRPDRSERPVLTWLRDRLKRVRGIA